MATYTSAQSGNWNNPATWGGGGYPSAVGDIANIGHTVTYNVVSTVELGGHYHQQRRHPDLLCGHEHQAYPGSAGYYDQ